MARKPKTSTPNRHTPVANELGLSELRLRLNFLEKENEKLLKQIEKKRTELTNFADGINELGIKMRERSSPLIQQLLELDQQIHGAFTEIFNGRKLGKQSRKNIESVYYSLQTDGLISPKPNGENRVDDQFSDDEPDWNYQEQRSQRDLEQEQAKPDREELKKIRHTYLRLAEIFHPDKTADEADKEYCTEVMKEVNQAYQSGDLAKLLAIEKQQELGQVINRNSTDDLSRQCAKVEAENIFLKSQFENLKQELRMNKNTHQGEMMAVFKKVSKTGLDPVALAMAEMEAQIGTIQELLNFVIDFRDRRITIKDFLRGPSTLNRQYEISDEELFEMIFR